MADILHVMMTTINFYNLIIVVKLMFLYVS